MANGERGCDNLIEHERGQHRSVVDLGSGSARSKREGVTGLASGRSWAVTGGESGSGEKW
jgi:hypothetical protein